MSGFAPDVPTLEQFNLDQPAIGRHRNALRAKAPIHVHRNFEEGRALAYDGRPFWDRYDRRRVRVEFFRGTDPRKHIHCVPPPHVQSAFDRAFVRMRYVAGARERFFLWLDPLTKRWAVWEEIEPGRCEMKARFEADKTPGRLASDLNDPSWEHARRRGIGEVRLPTFADFAELMELFMAEHDDDAICDWFHQKENEEIAEPERQLRDRERDVLDYYGLWVIRHDYNHGRRNYQTHSEPIPEQQPKIVEIDRGTHKVRVRVGSKFEEQVREEEAAKQRGALARADTFKRLEDTERRTLRERAKAATLTGAEKARKL